LAEEIYSLVSSLIINEGMMFLPLLSFVFVRSKRRESHVEISALNMAGLEPKTLAQK
jgi:hypothetical protein